MIDPCKSDNEEIRNYLEMALGIGKTDDLFSDLPKEAVSTERTCLSTSLSELEVRREVEKILAKNITVKEYTSFLGGGVWPHYVPAVVDAIASRGEFLTGYTPYQPEISQGILQALFEYQSIICELTNMDVANSSMYDWASSLGEAARMAARVSNRNQFLVPRYMSPEKKMVLKTYTEPVDIKIVEVDHNTDTGQIALEDLKTKISNQTAAVYIENPMYLGLISDTSEAISQIVHDVGGLFVMGVDPISLGVLKPPGDFNADIVIGEGQPLGNYLNSGGPLLGIFACRDLTPLIRQMPGRIIGMTTTKNSNDRAFCMALQTREQHIRRNRATSNICSNEALCAVRTAVFMSLLGSIGLKKLGENILTKTDYAIDILSEINGVQTPLFKSAHFKEFTINFDRTLKSNNQINQKLLQKGIIGGKFVGSEFTELRQTALYCLTELHTLSEINRLKMCIEDILEN